MKPEDKSDKLDVDIANYIKKDAKRRLWINIVLVFIVVLSIGQSVILLKNSYENHRILSVKIPQLERSIAERDKSIEEKDDTIKDQNSVITQAVDWILKLSNQIKSLGGTPPEIILKPEE